jgi:phage terminase Nu1 subunit (DNA packaging protein)
MERRIRKIELAELLGVNPRTLDKWRREGCCGVKLQAVEIGRTVGFTWSQVAAFQKQVEARKRRKSKSKPQISSPASSHGSGGRSIPLESASVASS